MFFGSTASSFGKSFYRHARIQDATADTGYCMAALFLSANVGSRMPQMPQMPWMRGMPVAHAPARLARASARTGLPQKG